MAHHHRGEPVAQRQGIFSALRHRNYRVFWFGFLFSIIGYQIQTVAQGWLVFDLTGSALKLGLVSGSQAVASIIFSLLGGVIADRIDRRRFLMALQCGMIACALALAILATTEVIEVWHIAVIAFLFGSLSAFEQPSRSSLVPNLVDREDITNAIALTSIVWQGSRVIGPALGGVILAFLGAGPCFFITTVGYVGVLIATFMVKIPARALAAQARENVLKSMASGIAYVRRNTLVASLMGMSFFNAFFGTCYQILMPVFAEDEFGVGPKSLGVLIAASGVGALMGTFLVATFANAGYRNIFILGGSIMFGSLLILFALSPWLPLSVALLVLIGATGSLYLTSITTLLQLSIDDSYRGRVMGVYALTYSLMPLGGLQAGAIAEVSSAPTAVIIGAIAVIVLAVFLALTNSALRSRAAMAAAANPAS